VSAERAVGERPRHAQLRRVRAVDLSKRAVAGVRVVARWPMPLAGRIVRSEIRVRPGDRGRRRRGMCGRMHHQRRADEPQHRADDDRTARELGRITHTRRVSMWPFHLLPLCAASGSVVALVVPFARSPSTACW
jgi:hypothetical protein